MAYVDRPDPPRRFGFTSYADDTPRFEAFDDPGIDEDGFGFEDVESDWEDAPLASSDASPARPGLIAFLAALLAGTLVAAVLAYFGTGLIRSINHRATVPQAALGPMATPPPQVQSAPAPAAGVAAGPPSASSQLLTAPRQVAMAKPRRAGQMSATRRLLSPLNCARPISTGQRMVCGSPGLRAEDRRMTRAYAEALSAGAPPATLRRDQLKWLDARETAARHSRRAVDHLYRRRIQVLESGRRGTCAARPSERAGLAGVTHWLLSVPRRIVSPRARADCG